MVSFFSNLSPVSLSCFPPPPMGRLPDFFVFLCEIRLESFYSHAKSDGGLRTYSFCFFYATAAQRHAMIFSHVFESFSFPPSPPGPPARRISKTGRSVESKGSLYVSLVNLSPSFPGFPAILFPPTYGFFRVVAGLMFFDFLDLRPGGVAGGRFLQILSLRNVTFSLSFFFLFSPYPPGICRRHNSAGGFHHQINLLCR